MSPKFWEYFLHIEADLAACSRYVEFSTSNYATFSNEFAKIIVVASAEIDAILRELSSLIAPANKADNINDYFPIITGKFPDLIKHRVEITRNAISTEPWSAWSTGKSPDWWGQGYNKIKHDRTNNFEKATLFNAIQAVGALFLTVLYYHEHVTGKAVTVDMNRGTQLFVPREDPTHKGGVFWYYGVK